MTEKSLDEENVAKEKQAMQKRISAVIPDAILLDSSVYGLFAIVPVKEEAEFTYFVSILEQVCCADSCWAMGISKEKRGIARLAESFKETEQAMRYLMADTRKKVIIFYQNIEKLFSEKSSQIQGDSHRISLQAAWRRR